MLLAYPLAGATAARCSLRAISAWLSWAYRIWAMTLVAAMELGLVLLIDSPMAVN
jgi:hypothetical protein